MVESRKIIDRVMEHTGWKQYEVAEKLFGISDKNLSNRIARNTIDLHKLIEWGIHASVDLGWLLAGIPPEASRQRAEAITLTKGAKYEGAEKRSGKDRRDGLAYESSSQLLQLERLNRAVFLLTVGEIKARLWALENLESPGDTLCNKPKNVEDKPA